MVEQREARIAAYRFFDVLQDAKEREKNGVVSYTPTPPPVGNNLQMEDGQTFHLEDGNPLELE